MSSSDPTTSVRPVPPVSAGEDTSSDLLWALVEGLDAAVAACPPDERPEGAMLLRVVAEPGPGGPATGDPATGRPATGDSATGESAELGVYPLDGDHPLDALLGFVAPPEWTALGVASTGLGHATGHGTSQPARSGPSGPVHVTVLLARSGASAGVIRRSDRVTRLAEPPGGVVADACRRALGLPTAPAPAGTAGLWTLSWLDRVLEAAADGTGATRPLSWPDVAALHPAAPHAANRQPPPDPPAPPGPADRPTSHGPSGLPGPFGPPDPAAPPSPPDAAALARSTELLAQRWTWSRLRAAPATATVPGPRLTAAQAAWMDDGMFARWLLAWFPPLDDLLDACRDLLPEPIAGQVGDTATLTLLDSEDTP